MFIYNLKINGIYKHSHEGLKWAKVWLIAMQGV